MNFKTHNRESFSLSFQKDNNMSDSGYTLYKEVTNVTFKIKDNVQLHHTRHVGKIMNMCEENGITYYAVRISYPDGSSDHYYHMKDSDLKAIC